MKPQTSKDKSVISLTEYVFKSAIEDSGTACCGEEDQFTDEEIDLAIDRCLKEKILPKNRIVLKRKFGI